jgi:hypothetical protein
MSESQHTGGLRPAKNELTGGAPHWTSPPAIPAGESVEMGLNTPRLETAGDFGTTPAKAVDARKREKIQFSILMAVG